MPHLVSPLSAAFFYKSNFAQRAGSARLRERRVLDRAERGMVEYEHVNRTERGR